MTPHSSPRRRLIAAVVLVAAAGLVGMGRASPMRDRLRHVTDYACYYGAARLDDLAKFDLVIVETKQYRPEEIAQLKARGVLVIGYLSVGQTTQLEVGDGRGPQGFASWYLDDLHNDDGVMTLGPDGDPDRDPEWKAYWVDLTAPEWQQRLDREVRRVLVEWGCDGVFLDTILYDGAYENRYREQQVGPALEQWVRRLRRRFPRAAVIANNGWAYLPRLAPIVDGIMVEEFTGRYAAHTGAALEHMDRIGNELVTYRRDHPKAAPVIFALDYAEPDDVALIHLARTRAREHGFLHSISSKSLEGIELYVLATVNPARELRAVRQGAAVMLTWDANRLHCQEAGVDRFVLKRAELSITTDDDWNAATLVSDELDPRQPYYVDEHAPAAAQWYALGALQTSGVELVGRVSAKATPASPGSQP